MSSVNSVRKNEEIKNLKSGEKKWPDTGIYTYYLFKVCLTTSAKHKI